MQKANQTMRSRMSLSPEEDTHIKDYLQKFNQKQASHELYK